MTKVKMSEFDLHEMRWNCEMARLCLEDHWGDGFTYNKRCKEAEWFIDYATLVFDEAEKRMTGRVSEAMREALRLKGDALGTRYKVNWATRPVTPVIINGKKVNWDPRPKIHSWGKSPDGYCGTYEVLK